MIIATQQLEALGAPHKEAFIAKTIAFLRKECAEWASSKKDDEIRESVERIINIGKKHGIKKEINVQRLLYHMALKFMSIKRIENAMEVQTDMDISEDRRTKEIIRSWQIL
ncbi:MAG: hypothetical protein WAS33_19375 [Candidatus Promineifilaceae bacterium]